MSNEHTYIGVMNGLFSPLHSHPAGAPGTKLCHCAMGLYRTALLHVYSVVMGGKGIVHCVYWQCMHCKAGLAGTGLENGDVKSTVHPQTTCVNTIHVSRERERDSGGGRIAQDKGGEIPLNT